MKHSNDKIYIIGAGAIGSTLAAFLQHEGKDVLLLRGHIKNQPPRTETVTVQLSDGKTINSNVTVSAINNYSMLRGVIVVATKSYGNELIAERLRGKTGNSPIVVMQNGLDVEDPFITHGFEEIYRCVLFTSCQYIENNLLKFKPAADSPIGCIRGNTQTLNVVSESLKNPYLIFKPEENIQPIIWTKAIINSVFNSVCPLLETDNGIFHRNQRALKIAKHVIDECITVAAAESVELSADKILDRLLLISKTSDGQLISTYQDLLHKRKTEIETLNLAIANKADKKGKTDFVNMTALLGNLIDIKSELLVQHNTGG